MLVESPWPVRTVVSDGSVSSVERIESMIVSNDEYDRPVAPGPPWNSVSPEKTVPRSGAYRQVEPGEWPGVTSARSVTPPAVIDSGISPSGDRSGHFISHNGASAGFSRIGAPKRSAS